jgi:hypothetical protein
MNSLHNHDVAAIMQPSQQPQCDHDAPTYTQCSVAGCHFMIEHTGDLVVTMCDSCLDILSGDAPMKTTPRPLVAKDYSWSGDSIPVAVDEAEVEAAAEAKDFGFMRAPMKLRAEIFGVSAAAAERSSEATPVSVADVDTTKVCATCVGLTAYRCGCGKMCCRDCVDEEGRCPGCDGEEA